MKVLDSILLKEKYGVADWGYTEKSIPTSLQKYEDWVEKGYQGPLLYMADHRKDIRFDLKNFFPEFKSALVFLFPYAKEKKQWDEFYNSGKSNGKKIAGYVMGFEGEDYHHYVKKQLQYIAAELEVADPELKTTLTLDVHPVLERDLAYRAGLGWFGRNSMFISKEEGSYFIIGSLLLNKRIDWPKDSPITAGSNLYYDHCGSCTACLDDCPTDAIDFENRTIISDKCISTYTIELFKDETEPPVGYEKSNGEIFGCDICQEVCPWNKKKLKTIETHWEEPKEGRLKIIYDMFLNQPVTKLRDQLNSLSNREFRKILKGTPLERTGRVGLLKNLK